MTSTIFQVVETGLTGEAFFWAKSRLGHQPTAASTSRLLCSNAHQTRHHTLPRGSANRTTADKSLYVRNLHGFSPEAVREKRTKVPRATKAESW